MNDFLPFLRRLAGLPGGRQIVVLPIGGPAAGKTLLGRRLLEDMPEAVDVLDVDIFRIISYVQVFGRGASMDVMRGKIPERKVQQAVSEAIRAAVAPILYVDAPNLEPQARAPYMKTGALHVAAWLDIPEAVMVRRLLHTQGGDEAECIRRVREAQRRLSILPDGEFDAVFRIVSSDDTATETSPR